MLQGEHSEIILAFIKLPFVIKIFVLSIFERPFNTGFTLNPLNSDGFSIHITTISIRLPILYVRGSQVGIAKLCFISFIEDY